MLQRCILFSPQGKIFFADLKRVIELVGENISDAEIEEMIKEVSPPTQGPDGGAGAAAACAIHGTACEDGTIAATHVTQRRSLQPE